MCRGYIKAEFTGWRDTSLMKLGKLCTEELRIRELRAHGFEVSYNEMSHRRRAFEFAPRVGLGNERR